MARRPSRTDDPNPPRCDGFRAELARILTGLAEISHDGRFAIAAGVLLGSRAGRKARDDAQAVAYATAQLRAGLARTRHDACRQAARLFATLDEDEAAFIRRLMNKLVAS